MSKSYREPYWTEGYGKPSRKKNKRLASKRVRRAKDLDNGMSYKKVYNSWDICDFSFYSPNDEKSYRK